MYEGKWATKDACKERWKDLHSASNQRFIGQDLRLAWPRGEEVRWGMERRADSQIPSATKSNKDETCEGLVKRYGGAVV